MNPLIKQISLLESRIIPIGGISGQFLVKESNSDFDIGWADFTATSLDIQHWNDAYSWGNHASAGYAIATNYYTKTNLQTSGQASVHWGNITNNPTTIAGYGITDAMTGNSLITGATHTKITYDTHGLVTGGVDLAASDVPALPWSKITSGLPTTIAGYGILDGYTKTQVDSKTWGWGSITGTPTTLAGYGITDAYTKAVTDAKTWDFSSSITGKPTTLSGYGITNALTTSSPAANVINSGLGTMFLADDGTYKIVASLSSIPNNQVIFAVSGLPSGSTSLTFNPGSSLLTSGSILATTVNIANTSTTITKDGSGHMVFTDTVSGSKTLASLVSGATNYWNTMTGGIYYANYVGVNSPGSLSEALTVNGNVQANNFNSSWFQYSNSNLLLGPSAGALETGSNLLYIANTNTSSPLIYGDFINQLLNFNADTYINSVKRLCFGDSTVSIRRDSSNNMVFQDENANGGAPVTLTGLTTLSGYALKSDFTAYSSVTTITAANLVTWGHASILTTGGSSTSFLAADGSYHSVSGGVTPTDNFAKWDTGSSYYRFYSSKTEAGGGASGGKFYLGTDLPTNTNRLNYDGVLYTYGLSINVAGTNSLVVNNTTVSAILGTSVSSYGGSFSSSSGTGLFSSSQTGICFVANASSGNTSDLAQFNLNGVNQVVLNSTGINLITGATYKINGVDILAGKQNTLVSGTTIKTINSVSLLGSGDISIGVPVDGILHWDGTAYNPYSSISGTSLIVSNSSTLSTYNTTGYFNINGSLIAGSNNTSFNLIGVQGSSYSGIGVYGTSNSNYGVSGSSNTGSGIYGASNGGNGIFGNSGTGNGLYGNSNSGKGIYGVSNTGVAISAASVSGKGLVVNNISGNTSNLVELGINSVVNFKVDYQGNVNIPTGATYQINGVPITAGGGTTPVDGVLHWDGTAYNPYTSVTGTSLQINNTGSASTYNVSDIFTVNGGIIGGSTNTAYINDGVFGASYGGGGIHGNSETGQGVIGYSTSGISASLLTQTGIGLKIYQGAGNSTWSIQVQKYPGTNIFTVDYQGNVNIPTGSTYQINGVPISGGGVTPIDGILHWDGTAYNPYASYTGTSLQILNVGTTSTYNATGHFAVNGNVIAGSTNASYSTYGISGSTYSGVGVLAGAAGSGIGLSASSISGIAIYGGSGTGKGLVISNTTGNTSSLADLQLNGTSKFIVDYLGNVNIPTGSTYQINGVPISSGVSVNSVSYTTSIPFNYTNTDIASHTLSANDVFTINSTGALDNTTSTVILTNSTSYTPDLTAFHQIGVYDNTYTYTYLEFFRKRGLYFVSIINVN
jgi:hypothetical protein